MDRESKRSQLIRAARTGKLTEAQYQDYLRLLEEDPDFLEEVEWEENLLSAAPIARDADLFAAADEMVFEERDNVFLRYRYAIAASIALLLVAGGLTYYFGTRYTGAEQIASRKIEWYNGDTLSEGQLGYADGDMPAGELNLKWWKDNSQKTQLSYRFCSDTLQIYFREPADTASFDREFKLIYLSADKAYHLVSPDNKDTKLVPCAPDLIPLLP